MNVDLGDDVVTLAEVVESVLAAHSTPAHVRQSWEDRKQPREDLWPRLLGIGLTHLTRGSDAGGDNLSITALMPVLQAAGRHASALPLVEILGAICPVLANEPGDDARRVLHDIDAGTTLASVQDGWDGYAPWGDAVEHVLVLDGGRVAVCRTSSETVETAEGVDGSRGLGRVSRLAQVAELEQPSAAAKLRAHLVLGSAANLNGLAEAVIWRSAAYAKDRRQFGRPIGSFQAIKHLLARTYSRWEFTHRYAWYAAWALSEGRPDAYAAVSRAKALAGDVAVDASYTGLQVHGGFGYTWECDLQLWLKRIQVIDGAYGTSLDHWKQLAGDDAGPGAGRR